MVGKPLASESFPVGTDLIQRARQSFVGDEQIAVPDVRTLNPSAPRLPSLLGNGLQKFVVLLSASRQKDTVLSQQAPVFSEPSLDISGRGFVHPDVEKQRSLGWRRERHGRSDRNGIVSDGSPASAEAALTSTHDQQRSPEGRSEPFKPRS